MSETLRIALVAEGPTDRIVIQAAIASILGTNSFVLTQLHPEESLSFGQLTGGWRGVYHWCTQAVVRAGGALRDDPLFVTFDALIVHLDADVAECRYADAGIVDAANDLPCSQPCPPPEHTTNPLRLAILRWLGATDPLPKTILCTPSRSIEAWVYAALYPGDPVVTRGELNCYLRPAMLLQAKPLKGRLVSGGKKKIEIYRQRSHEIATAWAQVRILCPEAHRFSGDIENILIPQGEAQ
jgi:hypothetical protein